MITSFEFITIIWLLTLFQTMVIANNFLDEELEKCKR